MIRGIKIKLTIKFNLCKKLQPIFVGLLLTQDYLKSDSRNIYPCGKDKHSFKRCFISYFTLIMWLLSSNESGANAIRIAGVVVVVVTCGVHIVEVVRVSRIRRTLPPIRSTW